MPSTPIAVGQGTAYDTAEFVLQHARAAINDVMQDQDGEILTDDWSGTWIYLEQGKRLVEHELANNGVEFNIKEVVFANISPVANVDPTTQVWISPQGYFDGTNNHVNPQIPADLVIPIRLWERFSGTTNPFAQITPAIDGLPGNLMQVQQFRIWDWRGDAIYFPGATQANDVRMRYVSYSPQLTAPDSVIPFRRSAMAIAFMTAWAFTNPRNPAQAATLYAMAKTEIDQIISSTVRRKQRRGIQKRAYGGQGSWEGPVF
jgi:hypothetical protein